LKLTCISHFIRVNSRVFYSDEYSIEIPIEILHEREHVFFNEIIIMS
jgi:hypothetical protein